MLEFNLYLTLKKHKGDIRKMLMNIRRKNPSSRSKTKFGFDTYQNNKAIRKVGSSKARSIPYCEANQCHGFPIQAFRFYENPSHVSCFPIGTLPRVYHSRKNL